MKDQGRLVGNLLDAASFNDRELFVAGEPVEFEGDTWVEITTRRPISDLLT